MVSSRVTAVLLLLSSSTVVTSFSTLRTRPSCWLYNPPTRLRKERFSPCRTPSRLTRLSTHDDKEFVFPSRRHILATLIATFSSWFTFPSKQQRRDTLIAEAIPTTPTQIEKLTAKDFQQYHYNSEWTGTALKIMSLDEADAFLRKQQKSFPTFDFGQWPDPILRRPAAPVSKSFIENRNEKLRSVAQALRDTARQVSAVGLAAQQCGIDARLVFLESDNDKDGLFLVNPQITARSPELNMVVWTERCLVLPPTFKATVLRDLWIDIQYKSLDGATAQATLHGEMARAAQHEMDHDRGILILDHVGLEDLENDKMRRIEAEGHEERMEQAYARYIT